MGKFLFAVLAAVASLVTVESLVCNNCPFSLLGVCVNQFNETCTLNNSVCYTGRSKFPGLPNFAGFNTQGCTNNTNCNSTTSYSLLGATYTTTITCCSSDRCNPVFLNGAPSTKMTFSAAVGGAVLATVLGSIM